MTFSKRAASVLSVFILLSGFTIFSVPTNMISQQALITNVDYVIREEVLILKVKISYSSDEKQTLKINVETSDPYSSYDRVIAVGPGADVESEVGFEMKPLPPKSSWWCMVSLYKSDEKSSNLDLLHMKNLDIDLAAARVRGALTPAPFILLLSSVALLGLILYLRRRKHKKGKKLGRKKARL